MTSSPGRGEVVGVAEDDAVERRRAKLGDVIA
jgi:hypothetical protein